MSGQSDTGYIPFEILVGTRRVSCGVSNEALEAAAGLGALSGSVARHQSFHRFRTLIHAAAVLKLTRSGKKAEGLLLLGSDDLRLVPLEKGIPVFGRVPRHAAVLPVPPSAQAVPLSVLPVL
ncbi:DUF1488 family protein [Acetobacter fallax]|nr:DUF1488 family protein [Acetobacter fallax]